MKSNKDRYQECIERIKADLKECDRLLTLSGYADRSWHKAKGSILFELENKLTRMNLPIIPRFLNYFGIR